MSEREDEVVVDLSEVDSSLELQYRLMTSLHFPDWYGRNWDAFWDAITGLVPMPHRLRLVGWDDFENRLPSEAQHLKAALIRMRTELPAIAAAAIYA